MKEFKISVFLTCFSIICPLCASGQSAPNTAEQEAINMIKQIYSEVSGKNESEVDWDKVRSFFIKEAVIVLKTSREGNTQFTVEEFIQDFKNFYNSSALGASGFKEEVLRLKSQVYGDAGSISVVYSANILDSDRPVQKGIDFWLLSRVNNTWKVLGVSNEIIPPGEEIPGIFED